MKLPDFIAFDLDGTLVDSEAMTVPDMLDHLSTYGIRLERSSWYSAYHGMAGKFLIDQLNKDFGTEIELNTFLEERRLRLLKIYEQGIPPTKNVSKALGFVENRDIPRCLVTNSPRWKIEQTVRHTELGGERTLQTFFQDAMFSGRDDVKNTKPAPDIYLYAAEKMDAEPCHAIAVEDSTPGVQAALRAGYGCVLGYVGTAHDVQALEEKLKTAGAHAVFSDWGEFESVITKLFG